MTKEGPPEAIVEAARARARARRERDWPTADHLKVEIEAAGWRIVDRGSGFELHPAVPPDVVVDGVVRYGSSGSVPSRLDEPPSGAATVVIVPWGGWPVAGPGTADAVRSFAAPDVSVVAVLVPRGEGDATTPAEAAGEGSRHPSLEREGPGGARSRGGARARGDDLGRNASGTAGTEVVEMADAVSPGTAANAGIRRAGGAVVVLLVDGATPAGDLVGHLVHALEDTSVGIAGGWGSATRDLRRHDPIEAGEAVVLAPWCLAFRRDDFLARGPLDERFLTADGLAAWWSLALRDRGHGVPPRRAMVVPGLPLALPSDPRAVGVRPGDASGSSSERARKRDFYRLLDRYGRRPDLTQGRSGP